MAAKNETLKSLFAKAELKFGFKFACELHQALAYGDDNEAQQMLRKVIAA